MSKYDTDLQEFRAHGKIPVERLCSYTCVNVSGLGGSLNIGERNDSIWNYACNWMTTVFWWRRVELTFKYWHSNTADQPTAQWGRANSHKKGNIEVQCSMKIGNRWDMKAQVWGEIKAHNYHNWYIVSSASIRKESHSMSRVYWLRVS